MSIIERPPAATGASTEPIIAIPRTLAAALEAMGIIVVAIDERALQAHVLIPFDAAQNLLIEAHCVASRRHATDEDCSKLREALRLTRLETSAGQ